MDAPQFITAGKETGKIPVRLSYRIIELFSDGLYSSPSKAIEELVSNAFDAGATNVHVILPQDRSAADATIIVADDGEGMDADGLRQHWLIGVSNKRALAESPKGRKQIGKFGIGKLATFVLARYLTHVSKRGGKYYATTMNYEDIPHGELRRGKKKLRVLDPMAGSGTTLVVAKLSGHDAVGFDVDPLSVVLAKAWCATIPPDKLRSAGKAVLVKAQRAENVMRLRDAYPCSEDEAATREYIRYWFNPVNRRQLTCLAQAILDETNDDVSNLLWCAFSRLIISKQASASLADDVSHGKPHRVRSVSQSKPFEKFPRAIEMVIRGMPFKSASSSGGVDVREGDARDLPLPSESIDAVITSPPYLNAIEYLRGHKLTMVWMGHTLDKFCELRSHSVGHEARLAVTLDDSGSLIPKRMIRGDASSFRPSHNRLLSQYVSDITQIVSEVSRVLVPNGRATFVVGNCNLRGVYVRNSVAVAAAARNAGLEPVSTYRRELPENRRYLPPPKSGDGALHKRMREEVVLKFRKPA